jgi:hypothetical protein
MNNKEFLKRFNITEAQYRGDEVMEGFFDFKELETIPKGFNPKVIGSLYMNKVKHFPKGFNPTVSVDIKADNLTSIDDSFNPTVGDTLSLPKLTSIPEGFSPTVGRDLYLGRVKYVPKGFNPAVGGNLKLNVLAIENEFNVTVGGTLGLWLVKCLPKGFSPKVGLNLALGRVEPLPEGFNPIVGGDIVIDYKTRKCSNLNNEILSWKNGKYIQADGIFTEVVSKKGNVYKVKKIGLSEEFYLVTNGKIHAHGKTVQEAKKSLQFKIKVENFRTEPITMETEISILHYRAITGACLLGVQYWMQNNNVKENLTVKELLPILERTKAYRLDKFKKLIK